MFSTPGRALVIVCVGPTSPELPAGVNRVDRERGTSSTPPLSPSSCTASPAPSSSSSSRIVRQCCYHQRVSLHKVCSAPCHYGNHGNHHVFSYPSCFQLSSLTRNPVIGTSVWSCYRQPACPRGFGGLGLEFTWSQQGTRENGKWSHLAGSHPILALHGSSLRVLGIGHSCICFLNPKRP